MFIIYSRVLGIGDWGLGGKLIFEGEYILSRKLNGKSYNNKGNLLLYELINENGKVRELNKDQMYYESDYFHGEKSGEGIEYYNREIILFEGKFFNGEKNGIGVEYDNDGEEVVYEGEFLYGERWNGKEIGDYENDYILNGKYL